MHNKDISSKAASMGVPEAYYEAEFAIPNHGEDLDFVFAPLDNPDQDDDRKSYTKIREEVLPVIIQAEKAGNADLVEAIDSRLNTYIDANWGFKKKNDQPVKQHIKNDLQILRDEPEQVTEQPKIKLRHRLAVTAQNIPSAILEKMPGKSNRQKAVVAAGVGLLAAYMANKYGLLSQPSSPKHEMLPDQSSSNILLDAQTQKMPSLDNLDSYQTNISDDVMSTNTPPKPPTAEATQTITITSKQGDGVSNIIERMAHKQGTDSLSYEKNQQIQQMLHEQFAHNLYTMDDGEDGIKKKGLKFVVSKGKLGKLLDKS